MTTFSVNRVTNKKTKIVGKNYIKIELVIWEIETIEPEYGASCILKTNHSKFSNLVLNLIKYILNV